MKIFTSAQIRELDKYTIEHEPITSINLMERAAAVLTKSITALWGRDTRVVVFAGPGNNGGDALAVARMLIDSNYDVQVFLFNTSGHLSDDCKKNRDRLKNMRNLKHFVEVTQEFDPPVLGKGMLVVDGIFGSGLNKPLTGGFASLVKYINASEAQVVSIDIPSGMMSEDNTYNVRANIIRANVTLTLGSKKLCMMMPDNQPLLGDTYVLDINLSAEFIEKTESQYSIVEAENIRAMMKPRSPFAHKGDMGHALLVAGSYGMAGAAVLASKACLRSGVGKLTIHTPKRNYDIMQISVPEAIMQMDKEETIFSQPADTSGYEAIGIGPGLGQNENTAIAVIAQIRSNKTPMVIDADALNILASHRAWMQQLPEGLILTPHPKELDRIIGSSSGDDFERLTRARELAQQLRAYVLLKGHFSALCMPNGHIVFNSTGNAGMATAGSGDVLTGIITGLLARGYSRGDAAVMGMYLHGLAGDLAAEALGYESMTASDIIKYLPKAFQISQSSTIQKQ